jgi:hypothetical protein
MLKSMQTYRTTRTAVPALVILAWLLLPQAAQCFYSPSTGKWLSRDPIEEKGGVNLHCFVQNRPVSAADSSGLSVIIGSPGSTVDRPIINYPGPALPPGSGGPGGTPLPNTENSGQNCAGFVCGIDDVVIWPGGAMTTDSEWSAMKNFVPTGCERVSNKGITVHATRCKCGERELIVWLYRGHVDYPSSRGRVRKTDSHMIGRIPCGGPTVWQTRKDTREIIVNIQDPDQNIKDLYYPNGFPGIEVVKLTFCCKGQCQVK